MFVASKLSRHARRASRKHTGRTIAGATLALTAVVSAGSIANNEPAQAEKRIVAASSHQAQQTQQQTQAPTPAPEPTTGGVAPVVVPKPIAEPAAQAVVYQDNLDGWIRESLDILKANNIPASYDGIYRNVMRESTGNPRAINLYDSNAAAGIPSKGLLQVIDPTFAAYHVKGTPFDIWNPVSNIVAACNYAAHRYGSMDNVNSAY